MAYRSVYLFDFPESPMICYLCVRFMFSPIRKYLEEEKSIGILLWLYLRQQSCSMFTIQ